MSQEHQVTNKFQRIWEVVFFSTQEELDRKKTETLPASTAYTYWERDHNFQRHGSIFIQFVRGKSTRSFEDKPSMRLGTARDGFICFCGLNSLFFNEFEHDGQLLPKNLMTGNDRAEGPHQPY